MSPTRMSKLESALRAALAFYDALNQHDIAAMMQLVSADSIFEDFSPAPDGGIYTGRQAITHYWENFFQSSPQAHVKIEDASGMGNRCIVRWRYEWEDAAGQKHHLRGVDLIKEADGLITEKRAYAKSTQGP